MKINKDLERIGDQAVNIAKRARALASHQSVPDPFDLKGMTSKVKIMLRDSLDSLINLDADLARKVCRSDYEVNEIHKSSYRITKEKISDNPEVTEAMILFLSVSRNLERTADLAENIAEDVLYMITGDIVRHGRGRSYNENNADSKPQIERVK